MRKKLAVSFHCAVPPHDQLCKLLPGAIPIKFLKGCVDTCLRSPRFKLNSVNFKIFAPCFRLPE